MSELLDAQRRAAPRRRNAGGPCTARAPAISAASNSTTMGDRQKVRGRDAVKLARDEPCQAGQGRDEANQILVTGDDETFAGRPEGLRPVARHPAPCDAETGGRAVRRRKRSRRTRPRPRGRPASPPKRTDKANAERRLAADSKRRSRIGITLSMNTDELMAATTACTASATTARVPRTPSASPRQSPCATARQPGAVEIQQVLLYGSEHHRPRVVPCAGACGIGPFPRSRPWAWPRSRYWVSLVSGQL